ncbi:MAG: tRNA-dihydrouridine synthase family protein [Clostridiales bacterium]|nr:tRNA-dihydrouridine synthase family protein [Clostridiales bacterium]
MKIYFAPLEGVTTYIYRKAYNEIYGHIDKFFSPFISPAENCPMTPRERKDIDPENNSGMTLVPQILTCRSEHFIDTAKELKTMGYREINLNLGCPSGTVCAKGKGAGFLQDTSALQSFLDNIYAYSESENMQISIKTRLGYSDPDEFYALMEIFNAFPVSELIVHPRILPDMYKVEPRKEYFTYALEHAKCPLVYNGNIFSCKDYDDLSGFFNSRLDPVMLGRGLISDPSLTDKLKGHTLETRFQKLRTLHDTVYHEYQKVMSPDINVLYKMRELWTYWQVLFDGKDRDIKRLMKVKKYAEYEDIAYRILTLPATP